MGRESLCRGVSDPITWWWFGRIPLAGAASGHIGESGPNPLSLIDTAAAFACTSIAGGAPNETPGRERLIRVKWSRAAVMLLVEMVSPKAPITGP